MNTLPALQPLAFGQHRQGGFFGRGKSTEIYPLAVKGIGRSKSFPDLCHPQRKPFSAFPATPFSRHISLVIGHGSSPKMSRFAAGRIVSAWTIMQDAWLVIADVIARKEPCNSMRKHEPPIEIDASVALPVLGSGPDEASGRFVSYEPSVEALPKALPSFPVTLKHQIGHSTSVDRGLSSAAALTETIAKDGIRWDDDRSHARTSDAFVAGPGRITSPPRPKFYHLPGAA